MILLARALRLAALILAFTALPQFAAAKTILVFAPHPDDESLIAAGRVRAAVLAGDTVKIVVVTNGDAQTGGVDTGLRREGESVAAAQLLGLTEQDVIFLGYPDASMLDIYNAASPTAVITSAAGQTQTYGNRGLGGKDFHSFRFGKPAPYNRVSVQQDMSTLLQDYSPDEIYTFTNFDTHPDHHATALFVTDALVAQKRSGSALATKLYQGIVWAPTGDTWPDAGGCAPDTPFTAPQMQTQLEWKRTWRAVVDANLKCRAIDAYASQVTTHYLSFARMDEFFWMSDVGANLAITATVTASSENSAANQGRLKAVDGVIDGAPNDAAREWVSANQLAGAWIQLDWSAPVSVAQVNLYDRPDGSENVLAGTLSFSDGTSIAVGALPTDGKARPVTFAPKTVTWVRFTINQAQGTATGLSEIQVLGLPAQSSANVAPHFIEGPGDNGDKAITSTQTATFSVLANDLNGDAVQYEWTADGGTIQGNGASAVFTPPAVAHLTVFTISARIFDGRGGSTTNVGFVTVTPAADALSVSPSAVVGGNNAQGTVTLANAAPAGGLSVPLSSSNPAAAQIPASVQVPAGATSASFPVSTSSVTARTTVTLSATINGTARTATLDVTPRSSVIPSGNLLLSPDSIGDPNWPIFGTTLSTTLNFAPAPDGTQSATRAVATQPGGHALVQQVAVAASTSYTLSFWARSNGGTAAAYSVFCNSIGSDIIAPTSYIGSINSTGWTQVSATFTTPAGCTSINVYVLRDSGVPVDVLLWRAVLVPTSAVTPVLSVLAVTPASLTGGASASGTVTLSGAAPAGGAQVTLSSSSPAAAVPASVTVPAGAASAIFSVTTSAVATSTAVTISGSFGGDTQSASLTVLPPAVSALIIVGTRALGGVEGAAATVSLSGPAPAGGAVVTLSSDSAAASVPASVTIPAGATSGNFNVTTIPVATPTTATISASYGGATRTGTLTVMPPEVASVNVSPSSVTGGTAVTGTVNLTGPAPAGGAQVTLSDNSAAASVPASVTVAAGARSASFSIGTSAVAGNTAVTVSASYGGATRTVTLTVLPAVLVSLTLNPTSVVGGPLVGNSTGTVTLNGPAPAGGAVVALSDNNAACSTPFTVTIPAGGTSATFTVATGLVVVTTTCTVTGTYLGASQSANLQISL